MIYILITLLLALGVFTASVIEDEKRCRKRNVELVRKSWAKEKQFENLEKEAYRLSEENAEIKKALADKGSATK